MAYLINYSGLDKLIHRLAFGAPFIQITAADMEGALFGGQFKPVNGARPIFITSLPRAGTTLTLEVLSRFPSLATHTYRDMPFVMAPIFWSRLGGAFQKTAELAERAHGDGMQVGYDSPEAFEEILWRQFWPDHYHEDRIDMWGPADGNEEARAFFVDHFRKIIALRRPGRAADGRYISKNNGNMARLALLPVLFPDASVVVPLRHPLDHAQSLLRQHLNFLEMHKAEPFVKTYMGDIGHYEFGELHRPIAFPGLAELIAGRDPTTLDYWLAYWIAGFDHVAGLGDGPILLCYEGLCGDPGRHLPALCDRLEIDPEGQMEAARALFRTWKDPARDPAGADPNLLTRAEARYQSLRKAAIGG